MSYDYGLGESKYDTNFIRIRHQNTVPTTLREMMINYFNITEDTLKDVMFYWWKQFLTP